MFSNTTYTIPATYRIILQQNYFTAAGIISVAQDIVQLLRNMEVYYWYIRTSHVSQLRFVHSSVLISLTFISVNVYYYTNKCT
jgi:hypothetical protein